MRKDAVVPPGARRRGGVAIYIKDHIPFRTFNINTQYDIQAIEVKTTQSYIAIVNLYAPPSTNLGDLITSLNTITANITTPYLICGDINAHHPAWETHRNQPDTKGQQFYDFINNKNLVILNDGTHTFPARKTRDSNTTPDITVATPNLSLHTAWHTTADPLTSDHLPIYINIGHTTRPLLTTPRFNLKRANWYEYREQIENTPIANPTATQMTDLITQTAHQHIPQTKTHHKHPKATPWWNYDCTRAITLRNTARNRFKRNKTEENLVNYKKARAKCRKLIKEAKRTSFKELANTFNRYTPLSKLWQITRAFKGFRPPLNKAMIIMQNDITYSTPDEITQQFAEFYHSIASQCPPPTPLVIPPNNDTHPYNSPLTMIELEEALSITGNSAPGPDKIHYHCFKQLGCKGKLMLLQSLNHAYRTHTYPETWFHAHVVPKQKPNKDTHCLASYRPISLTNTIHKIFERIIKQRLMYIIKKEDLIIPEQCGFMPGRSTTDNLVRLTADIKDSITSRKTTAALFLDLKNAYDTLNITTLLTYLNTKITGNLLHYLNNYLTRRSFQIKYLGTLSETKFPTTGLMQGSVLSPILFILALNSTLTHVPHPSKIAIYADDIVIWTTAHTEHNALRDLEKALYHVQHSLAPLNLHISPEKTQCVLFSLRTPTNPLPLTINNNPIKIATEAKFLGVTLDRSLTFKTHISNITSQASRRINILKALSGTDFGGDTKTLLTLYKSIIRPILEYASIIFENAAKTHLQKLDTIQNTALRIATCAFHSTPIDSLHVYTNMPTLADRRTTALFKYFYKIQKIPKHPCIPIITYRSHRRHLNGKHKYKKAYGTRITHHSQLLNIKIPTIRPKTSPVAWWTWRVPELILLIDQKKTNYNNQEILSSFHHILAEHQNFTQFYTDGSKSDDGTAAAAIGRRRGVSTTILKARLPAGTSIYTAELYAILAAYIKIKDKNYKKSIIISDSLSALKSIHPKFLGKHPLIDKIIEIQNNIQSLPKLLWIPSHTGIPYNEKVDVEAKEALNLPDVTPIPPIPDEFLNKAPIQLKALSQQSWSNSFSFLRTIHPQIGKWETINQNSKIKEKCIARLRFGHTKLTHPYMAQHNPPPYCNNCNNARLTVPHLLIECPKYTRERLPLIQYCNNHRIDFSLKNVLGDDYPQLLDILFNFLRQTGLNSEI